MGRAPSLTKDSKVMAFLPAAAVAAMAVSFMGSYRIFYGEVYSPAWYFLYYGKYILTVLTAALALFYVSTPRERQDRNWLWLVMGLPVAVTLVYSALVWLFSGAELPFISRGCSNLLFRSVAVFSSVCFVYLFGKKAVRYGLLGALIPCVLALVLGVFRFGGRILLAFVGLLPSFRGGEARMYLELHEINYVLGMYLIIMLLLDWKQTFRNGKLLLVLAAVFFVSGWKRIGLAALAATLIFGLILGQLKEGTRKKTIQICGLVGVVACLCYVALTASGNLTDLLDKLGIDMMGRNTLYHYFARFCKFSPLYFGHGEGFVSRQFDYMPAESAFLTTVKALHNDLFRIFIDLGFWGFLAWSGYWLVALPRWICRRFGSGAMTAAFLLIVFSFLTYLTDNTEGYFSYQMYLVMLLGACACKQTDQEPLPKLPLRKIFPKKA